MLFRKIFLNEAFDDDRKKFTSFAANKPHVISQSYVFPRTVTAMGVTRTQAGITTREILCNLGDKDTHIIVGLVSGQLYGLNKRFLDPRRPMGKLSSDDKEEGLIMYRPSLDYNPKFAASRGETVRNLMVGSPNR